MRIFYRKLLDCKYDKMSMNEKIVYSFLLYKSISVVEEMYVSCEGNSLDSDFVMGKLEYYDNYIPKYRISTRKLSDELSLSTHTITECIKNLKKINVIKLEGIEDAIYFDEDIIRNGFEDISENILDGNSLKFYLFLKAKSYPFHGIIDTYQSGLAKEFGCSVRYIGMMIEGLVKKGYIIRNNNLTKVL